MIIEIGGKKVEVDDSFNSLSEAEQHKQIDDIAKELTSRIANKTQMPAEAGAMAGAAAGATGAAGRKVLQGVNALNRFIQSQNPDNQPRGYQIPSPAPAQRPHEVYDRLITQGQANSPFRINGPTDVVNWASGATDDRTGQYQRGYMGGPNMGIEAQLQREADILERSRPGQRVTPRFEVMPPHLLPPNAPLSLIPEAEAQRLVDERAAQQEAYMAQVRQDAQRAANLRANRLNITNPRDTSGPVSRGVSAVTRTMPITGALAGANALDLANRMSNDQHGQAAISGLGLASAAAPWVRALPRAARNLGAGLSLAAPLVNKGIDFIQGYADGSSVKKLVGGLGKFLEPSAVKTRMYHGTKSGITGDQGITQFHPNEKGLTFVSPEPDFANAYARTPGMGYTGGAVYPVHVQATNPFDYQNREHVNALVDAMKRPSMRSNIASGDWMFLEHPDVLKNIKNLGHDSMFVEEYGVKNLGLFNPNKIKSATGNIGTYDVNVPDINKAEGGSTTPAWQRSEGKNPEGGLNAAGRASYNRETGGHLKAPQPEGGSRKDSFCARMKGMKKKLTSSKTANDPDSRINKSLRKWKC